jgi:hypothetical protein
MNYLEYAPLDGGARFRVNIITRMHSMQVFIIKNSDTISILRNEQIISYIINILIISSIERREIEICRPYI